MSSSPFKVTGSEVVWSCPWYFVRRDRLLLPDGSKGEYNVVVTPPAVLILPVTEDGQIILIKQFRHTVNTWSWEVPAGSVDEGEAFEAAAKRELLEEIGGRADKWTHFGLLHTAPGFSQEVCHIFLAENVVTGTADREPMELIEVQAFDPVTVYQMARSGEIKDSLTLSVLIKAQPKFGTKTVS